MQTEDQWSAMETSARSPFHGVAAGWLLPMGSRALAERIARTVVRAFYDDVGRARAKASTFITC